MSIVNDLIKSYDYQANKMEENHIFIALCQLNRAGLSNEEICLLERESLIFSLQENFNWNNCSCSSWGTYFGPFSINEKTYPSLEQITEDVVMHSYNRIEQFNHPMLKARYASVVWDFKKKIIDKNILASIPKTIIENCILSAKHHPFKHGKYVTNKLKYALAISISIRNRNYIQDVINEILSADITSCDILEFIIKNENKIDLNKTQEDNIIKNLNVIIDSIDYMAAKKASLILANYYGNNNNSKGAKDIITKYIENIMNQSSIEQPLVWLDPLKDALKLAESYGLETSTRKKISNKLREVGNNMHKDMKIMQIEMNIDFHEFDHLIKNLLSKRKSIDHLLNYLAQNFISKRRDLENELNQLIASNPITCNANRSALGPNNLTAADLNDEENNLVYHASQSIHFKCIFLRRFIESFFKKKRKKLEKLNDIFSQSSLFPDTHHIQLRMGLDTYIKGNTISAIYILIPQFENAIRILLNKNNHNKLSAKQKSGGIAEQMLGSLLSDEVLKEILGEDIILHFKTIYTHPAGLNLRNLISHGLANDNLFVQEHADLVFHSLLVLTKY